jgi:hypothetical protein
LSAVRPFVVLRWQRCTTASTVQRKKIQKIIQRQATHVASRSDDPHRGPRRQRRAVVLGSGHVWAGIYGFDSVFNGPGRFALDLRQLRQKYDDLRRFYASRQMHDNCSFSALTPFTDR